jgi:hypothetical protein
MYPITHIFLSNSYFSEINCAYLPPNLIEMDLTLTRLSRKELCKLKKCLPEVNIHLTENCYDEIPSVPSPAVVNETPSPFVNEILFPSVLPVINEIPTSIIPTIKISDSHSESSHSFDRFPTDFPSQAYTIPPSRSTHFPASAIPSQAHTIPYYGKYF